jgi:hypothetical protein
MTNVTLSRQEIYREVAEWLNEQPGVPPKVIEYLYAKSKGPAVPESPTLMQRMVEIEQEDLEVLRELHDACHRHLTPAMGGTDQRHNDTLLNVIRQLSGNGDEGFRALIGKVPE